MIYNTVQEMIGNTPLLRIDKQIHGIPNLDIYAKLEMCNPFGSIKDRVAHAMLEKVDVTHKTVLESSSGNTAKALSALCAMKGIPLRIITNRIKVSEVRDVLHLLGCQLTELPGISECPDPNNPKDPYNIINDIVAQNPQIYVHLDQYANPQNVQAHKKTGKEIYDDLGDIDYFFSYLGTCGSSRGIGESLHQLQQRKLHLMGVVTEQGGFVPGGRTENELFEVPFFERSHFTQLLVGTVDEAIDGMHQLHTKVGLLCGPTTGLVYSAILKWFREHPLDTPTTVVFIACDRVESYMSYLKRYRPTLFMQESTDQQHQIDQQELESVPETLHPQGLLVDIRTHFAFASGHIENSLNIPQHNLDDMIRQAPVFPPTTITIVCPIGAISRKYAALLRRQGYEAYTLSGGLKGWVERGGKLKVVKDGKRCAHDTESNDN